MPFYTAVPMQLPAEVRQDTLVESASTLTQPIVPVTPIRRIGYDQNNLIAQAPAPLAADASAVDLSSPGAVPLSSPVRLFSVHFPIASAALTPEQKRRVEILEAGRCYLVVGHADPTGPRPRLVLDLSRERAQAVAGAMRAVGLDARIEAVGALGAGSAPADYPGDRRADVWRQACTGASR